MGATAILALLQNLGPVVANIVGIANAARGTFSSEDQAKLDVALASLQAQNDATFTRLDAKLAAAEKL